MTFFLAALRDGKHLVYMSSDGRWLPLSVLTAKNTIPVLRKYRYAASAIEVADLFAKRANCGWRVEMVTV